MSDLMSDPKSIVQGAMGLLLTGFGMLFKRHVSDYSRLKDQVRKLRETGVSRSELKEVFTQLRDDRQRMHEENKGTMSEMRQALERVHSRVDSIYERGA